MPYTMASVARFIDPDFGPDPYFERFLAGGKVSCSEQHLEYMFKIVWPIFYYYDQALVGQSDLRSYTNLGMFAVGSRHLKRRGPGHVSYLTYPGTGKTLLARIPPEVIGGKAGRFQGAADVLPADYTGNRIIDFDENGRKCFRLVAGPGFTELQLCDEFNRVPPRAQSAVLEVLDEGTITIFGETHKVNSFIIITGNPVETEGTYPLSEALLDRFMFQLVGKDFTAEEFTEIIRRTYVNRTLQFKKVCGVEKTSEVREFFDEEVFLSPEVDTRMGRFAAVSNNPQHFGFLRELHRKVDGPIFQKGLSGRGIIHWAGASKTLAAFRYRNYVLPEDARKVLLPLLRHRMIFAPGILQFLASDVFKVRDKTEARDEVIKLLIKEAW